MDDRKLLGKIGEDMAEAMLFSEGFTILERNYRSYYGEADIICEEDKDLVFVEVKTRTTEFFGDPGDAVDGVKKCRIRRIAEDYLMNHRFEALDYNGRSYEYEPNVRFRVIEILVRETDDDLLV